MAENKKKGNKGEQIAAKYLTQKGYNIIQTNYRCKSGEIDIICNKNDVIIFVEVKYRKNANNGSPLEAVDLRKRKKILEVATNYIWENDLESNFRFDVIGITDFENINIDHVENAF